MVAVKDLETGKERLGRQQRGKRVTRSKKGKRKKKRRVTRSKKEKKKRWVTRSKKEKKKKEGDPPAADQLQIHVHWTDLTLQSD